MTSNLVKKPIKTALALFILLTVLICSTPSLNKGVLMGLLSIFSVYFVVTSEKSYSYMNNNSVLLYAFSFLCMVFLYRLVGYSDAKWSRYVVLTLSVFILLLGFLISGVPETKKSNRLRWLIVIICVLNISWNIYMAIIYPELHLYMELYDLEYLQAINVGASDFYTFTLFFYVITLFIALNAKEKKIKILMLLCALTSGFFIIGFCFKASVVVLMILATILLYIFRGRTRVDSIFLGVLVAIAVLFLIFFIFSTEIIDFIVKYSPSERLTYRLVGLLDENSDYGRTSSIEARQNLWLLSLNTWIESPMNFVFGVGDHFTAGGNSESGVGQHSEFLDFLACYGLMGGLLVYALLKKCWNLILNVFDSKYRIQLLIILFIFLICGITKRVFIPAVICVIFIMLPLCSNLINNKS